MKSEQTTVTIEKRYRTEAVSAKKIRSGQPYLYRKNGYTSTVLETRMKDTVDGEYLKAALETTLERFPYLSQKLVEKDGIYYLFENDIPMHPVYMEAFRTLGSAETGYHLLDVTYTNYSIRAAFHHALCDGRGIKTFVETLIYYYCSFMYNEHFSTEGIHTIEEYPDSEETVEPYGTDFFPVDTDNVTEGNSDGFALPESEAEPTACYRTEVTVSQNEFIQAAKKIGATPGILAAMLASGGIFKLHPEAEKPVVCSMAMDLRSAIGMDKTHRNCTGSIYLPYSQSEAESNPSEIAAEYRELLSAQRSADSVKASLNKQIGLFNKVDSFTTLEEKRRMLSFFDKLNINTYVISYLGLMKFNDFGKYVESVHLYGDKIRGLTINMVAAGDTISFDILQGFESPAYVKAFLAELDRCNIHHTESHSSMFSTGKDMSYITASYQSERDSL